MINDTLKLWHQFIEERNPALLKNILADNAAFYSPVLWKPQEGKMLTQMYLTGAMMMFLENGQDFKYVREVIQDHHAILEFTATIDGIVINGVDMIEIDNNGKIISFKVMIRPLKAIEKVKEIMASMLGRMKK